MKISQVSEKFDAALKKKVKKTQADIEKKERETLKKLLNKYADPSLVKVHQNIADD